MTTDELIEELKKFPGARVVILDEQGIVYDASEITFDDNTFYIKSVGWES